LMLEYWEKSIETRILQAKTYAADVTLIYTSTKETIALVQAILELE